MSLTPILKVTLKKGISGQEFQDALENISLVDGVDGIQESRSESNVLYCGDSGVGEVDQRIRKISNVVAVSQLML